MSGGANIVEQYAGADVPARIELLIKYYPNFIRLVEGYKCLFESDKIPVIFYQKKKYFECMKEREYSCELPK